MKKHLDEKFSRHARLTKQTVFEGKHDLSLIRRAQARGRLFPASHKQFNPDLRRKSLGEMRHTVLQKLTCRAEDILEAIPKVNPL